jgi:rod shape-determining protein MreD
LERTGFLSGWRVLSNVIPVALALFGTILSNLPVSFTGNHVPAPLLGLMPVYFWCLVRPDLMTPAWAFAIGFLEDLLAPGAPGVWAASFVITYAVVSRQRDAFASLSGVGAILGFATAALVCGATQYLIVAVLNWRLLPLAPVMGELLTNVILYVPVAALLGSINYRLIGPSRSEF